MVNAIPATIKVMMPLAIGSAMPADTGVEMWLRSLAFLLGIAVALKHLLGKKTAVPNPLTVEHFKKKADHDDLQDLEKEMRAIVERERDTHRNSLRDLHHRIDQVAIAASRTDAQLAEVKKNTDLILEKLL
jgi:glucose-6-phosphate-specific signal transduction histidine kinase